MPHEAEHGLLQLGFPDLAVTDADLSLGRKLLNAGGAGPDGFHAVMHEVDLAAAPEFELDGGLDQRGIEGRDDGLDRKAVLGRGFDHRHIAQSQQRHMQGARDGRGAHGQNVDALLQLLQALLVFHAEALLLIDDHHAEIFELHVLREEAMRADGNIDLAFLEIGERGFEFPGRTEPAEHVDADGKGLEAFLKGLEVLEAEHGGGREHGYLLAVA